MNRFLYSEINKISDLHYFDKECVTGIIYKKYENNKICFEKSVCKGLLEGLSTYWYKSGKRQCEESYENGKILFKKIWFRNGSINTISRYLQGRPNGKQEVWNKENTKVSEEIYINGKKEGECLYWHDNGQLMWSVYYSNGCRGDSIYWDNCGNKRQTIKYLNNKDYIVTEFHSTGDIWVERTYKSGVLSNLKNYDDLK